MSITGQEGVTTLLGRVNNGDQDVLASLYPKIAGDLRRIAHRRLATRHPRQDLPTTILVDDAFLKLLRDDRVIWTNRDHFLGCAKVVISRLFFDDLRRVKRMRHGEAKCRGCDPSQLAAITDPRAAQVDERFMMNEAIAKLGEIDPVASEAVRLRLEGYTFEEIGEKLGIGRTSAHRKWRVSRAWLRWKLSGDNGHVG